MHWRGFFSDIWSVIGAARIAGKRRALEPVREWGVLYYMSDSPLFASRKCPACQQWSGWEQRPADRCEHCGALLDPRALESAAAREALANQKTPSVILIEIQPTDGPAMRFFKTIIRGGQLAFAAIMTFILWLVAAAAA